MTTSRMYGQRLAKDIAELFNHDFRCNSSNVIVRSDVDSSSPEVNAHNIRTEYGHYMNARESVNVEIVYLDVCIFEGPYRNGKFQFQLMVPSNYPFKVVEVRASHPIWHPNVDLQSGRLSLPIEWSPVLNLVSLAVSVQMIMLEPSTETPFNVEALSLYLSNISSFDSTVQKSLTGHCSINGIAFPQVLMSVRTCQEARDHFIGNTRSNYRGHSKPFQRLGLSQDNNMQFPEENLHRTDSVNNHNSFSSFKLPQQSSFYAGCTRSRSCSQLSEQDFKTMQDDSRLRKRPFYFDDDDDEEDDTEEDNVQQISDANKSEGQMDLVDDEDQHHISNACSQLTIKPLIRDTTYRYNSISAPPTPAGAFGLSINSITVGSNAFDVGGSVSSLHNTRNSNESPSCVRKSHHIPLRKIKKLS